MSCIVKETMMQMKYRTCFSSISQNGYKLDILKSGMQKYLRRKQFDAWKLHSEMICSIMMEYKFTKELFEEVRKNYNNLLSDLVGEGFQETVV